MTDTDGIEKPGALKGCACQECTDIRIKQLILLVGRLETRVHELEQWMAASAGMATVVGPPAEK